MKFGQVIVYNKINIFFKNHAEIEAERLVQDLPLFVLKKHYMSLKQLVSSLVSIHSDRPQLGMQ